MRSPVHPIARFHQSTSFEMALEFGDPWAEDKANLAGTANWTAEVDCFDFR
jgi:hypothetical protein